VAGESDWRRRARQSLESLRAAGVDWVQRAVPVMPPTSQAASMPRDMFDDSMPADGTPSLTLQQRKLELVQLAETVAKCQRCSELCSTRTQTVFGVGPLDVEVCCVGEAPGADEDKQGEPFVGAAGQLLTKILAASGFSRDEVYICNILKCRPPNNRTPKPEEAENCREYLDKQLKLVRPKYMIAFGGTAAQNLLKTTAPIGKLRGQFHEYNGIPVMVTYHPAYLLPHRAPAKKKDVWDDMKMLLKKMGRPIPPVGGQG
jgi:DNA polymerase